MKYYNLKNNNNKYSKFNEIASGIYEEKKSKFLSYIFTILDENDANNHIEELKSFHKDARHFVHIYSYKIGDSTIVKFFDDGEPQGTGTSAIYKLLVKENITNICIVIVRYFGGVLLGAGPLLRAYLTSAKNSINKCSKQEIYEYLNYTGTIEYNNYNKIKSKLDEYVSNDLIKINNIEFQSKININFDIEKKLYISISELLK